MNSSCLMLLTLITTAASACMAAAPLPASITEDTPESVQPNGPFHGLEGLKHLESAIVPGIYDASVSHVQATYDTEAAYAMNTKDCVRETRAVHAQGSSESRGRVGVAMPALNENVHIYLNEGYSPSFYSTTPALVFSTFLAIALSAWIRKSWSWRELQGRSTPSFKGNGKYALHPHFIAFSVPYLCRLVPYDYNPRGFWDFPERKGWMLDGKGEHWKFPNEIVWDLHDLDSQYACRRRSIPEELLARRPQDSLTLKCYRIDGSVLSFAEEVAFLQAWLFFGVIAEVSSICGLCGSSIEAKCVNFVQDGPICWVSLDNNVRSRAPPRGLARSHEISRGWLPPNLTAKQ
ncbi:hypothetical protein EV421DRAFT_1737984 [Armillaria borealis]|uniref:Uncharacterized protein n=1 Tax=Armillaria borealis TaxID=47425 RepID=A0AA39MM96_9AGAR|nr:hypothetical protein EV421DRAFT_1737984 [Armillaria borealis]